MGMVTGGQKMFVEKSLEEPKTKPLFADRPRTLEELADAHKALLGWSARYARKMVDKYGMPSFGLQIKKDVESLNWNNILKQDGEKYLSDPIERINSIPNAGIVTINGIVIDKAHESSDSLFLSLPERERTLSTTIKFDNPRNVHYLKGENSTWLFEFEGRRYYVVRCDTKGIYKLYPADSV